MKTCPNCQKTLDNMEAKLEFCSACQWDSSDDEPADQPPSLIQWHTLTLNDELFLIPVLTLKNNEQIYCCIGFDEKLDSQIQEIGTMLPNMKAEAKGRLSDVMHLEVKMHVIESLRLYQWPFEQFPNPVLVILTNQ